MHETKSHLLIFQNLSASHDTLYVESGKGEDDHPGKYGPFKGRRREADVAGSMSEGPGALRIPMPLA